MRASKAAKSIYDIKNVNDDANGLHRMILHCQVCSDIAYAHLLQIESWAPFTHCGCTHG